ncbi:MAG: hypothetical protein OEY74_11755 [Gammaproteobacteria bacterium]|nr:hypothetical protein [Gammaproteobacteria bacterium]
MDVQFPAVGEWYRRPSGTVFEVVAVDEEDGTIEIQQFDGTIGEIDIENWPHMLLLEISPPEDWSGAVDMDPDDYVGTKEGEMPSGFHDPLEFLEET